MALYSDKVMEHFLQPRNVGVIEDADGVGEVGNAKCGDIMKMYLKIDDDIITDVKFETFGCASAIASSSMATELIFRITRCTVPYSLKRLFRRRLRTISQSKKIQAKTDNATKSPVGIDNPERGLPTGVFIALFY